MLIDFNKIMDVLCEGVGYFMIGFGIVFVFADAEDIVDEFY